MASLADFAGIYGPETPAGFNLANIALQRSSGQAGYDLARDRIMRDFTRFDLPQLLSAQAARGALGSGATRRKVDRSATGVNDALTNLALQYGGDQARLGTDALLGITGTTLGSLV
jgi:hypothetical protein